MEWNFQINWPATIEEAKQRRKKLGITQQRLAILANVSTPTISNFENGDENILLNSILKILEVLGMTDIRRLIFTDPASYNQNKMTVIFWGKDGDKYVRCEISYEALSDHFGLNSKTKKPIMAFELNKSAIEHEANRKYLANKLREDGSILIKTSDL